MIMLLLTLCRIIINPGCSKQMNISMARWLWNLVGDGYNLRAAPPILGIWASTCISHIKIGWLTISQAPPINNCYVVQWLLQAQHLVHKYWPKQI
jgi:hypothetical protein